MKRYITLFFLAGILYGCTGLEVAGINVRETFSSVKTVVGGNTLTPEQTKSIGDELGAELLAIYPPVQNREQQRYLNAVGGWLAMHAKHKSVPWRFALVESPTLNAFSTPSGLVVVSTALLESLESEHELAAVLAHEIAHVDLLHHVTNIQRSQKLSSIANLADNALIGSGGKLFSAGVIDISKDLYGKGLERDDEFAADYYATELLQDSGYDPYALISMLQTIELHSAEQAKISGFFLTHPQPLERINAVYKDVEYYQPAFKVNDETLKKRFTLAAANASH